jgi:NTP pyrophosphatase (non-canonical NTP hydrolase)
MQTVAEASTSSGEPLANAVPANLQARVHAMVQNIGGYWRPVNAVARLLEELAELGQELTPAGDDGRREELAGEFADLWIITTCLANQFNIVLADGTNGTNGTSGANGTATDRPGDAEATGFVRLVEDAGRIARVVNYYDGPKNPRSLDGFPTLTAAISTFHRTLRTLAVSSGVDLDAAVDSKVTAAGERDRGRFALSYDPSTADSLRGFRAVLQRSRRHPSGDRETRLWGAPTWDGHLTVEHNVDQIIPFLTCFAKAAERENLDGFVIRLPDGPETADLPALSRRLSRVLTCLAARGPRPNGSFPAEVRAPGWQFSFRGARLLISVFSPLYPASHGHHAQQGTFVLLKPVASPGLDRAE